MNYASDPRNHPKEPTIPLDFALRQFAVTSLSEKNAKAAFHGIEHEMPVKKSGTFSPRNPVDFLQYYAYVIASNLSVGAIGDMIPGTDKIRLLKATVNIKMLIPILNAAATPGESVEPTPQDKSLIPSLPDDLRTIAAAARQSSDVFLEQKELLIKQSPAAAEAQLRQYWKACDLLTGESHDRGLEYYNQMLQHIDSEVQRMHGIAIALEEIAELFQEKVLESHFGKSKKKG